MNRKIFSALLIGTVLSSCTMMPHYKRPDMPVSEDWAGETGSPQAIENEKLANQIQWQDFFQSPSMQKVIQTSLDNNRNLRIAALNVEATRETYRIQRADLLPTLNAQATGTRGNRGGGTTTSAATNTAGTTAIATGGKVYSQYSVGLGVTAYELDLFGRVRSLSEAALEDYFATQEARNAAQISLISETANTYLQWLADKKALKLTEETLKAQQQSYDVILQNNENGIGSRLDVSQAKTAVETANVNQALYTRLVGQDENALMLLMGVTDKNLLPKEDDLDQIKVMQDLPVGLPSQVLLLRPDIQQAEHNLKSRNANIGAARANFFPVISLTGSFGFGSTSLGDLFNGSDKIWNFAPQAVLPVFTGGRNLAILGNAKAQKEIAVAQYEQSIQSAFREVADELVARRTLDDQKKGQDALVQATQESYDISNARYKEGIDSFLNVLDAQRSLYTAQQNAIDIERQRLANLVNLYKVLGGGVTQTAEK